MKYDLEHEDLISIIKNTDEHDLGDLCHEAAISHQISVLLN